MPWRVKRSRSTRVMAGAGRALLALLAFVAALASWARAAPSPSHRLQLALDADELELAALAQRLGEAQVLTALGDATDPASQLAALRLTPHLLDAELALAPLARLAAGRDPELAPPAAQRLLRIAQALVRARAGSRELLPSELEPAQAALRAFAQDATARADIRSSAAQAAQLLGTLGVTAAAGVP
jgi:hypothetical protein